VERHLDSGVPDGEYTFQFTQFSGYLTTYYWRIELTDGTDTVVYIFHFTTLGNMAPTIAFPSPGNGSTGNSASPTTSITVGDLDVMTVDWLEWTGTAWILAQRSGGLSSGTYDWIYLNATIANATYYWAVNATDGSLNTTRIYHFTIGSVSPPVTDEGLDWWETIDLGMVWTLFLLIIVMIVAGLGAVIRYSRDVT